MTTHRIHDGAERESMTRKPVTTDKKSKVIAVTMYPADLEIIRAVMADYDCNRSAAMRMIVRDYDRIRKLADVKAVTVRELTDIIFSSFAQDGE